MLRLKDSVRRFTETLFYGLTILNNFSILQSTTLTFFVTVIRWHRGPRSSSYVLHHVRVVRDYDSVCG